jgi:hypothetical protein
MRSIKKRKMRSRRFVVLLVVAAVAATSAYAYTNAVGGINPPLLGSGTGTIEKYALGTPTYTLNANSPRNLDSVSFTLTNATASTVVRIRLIDTSTTWYNCDESGAPAVITCATTAPQATAAAANGNNLTVVASG